MADAYKGLTIEFRGDSTDLDKALRKLRSESTSVERELRSIDRALELDPGNVELLGQKARYTSQQANLLQERLDLVNRALSDGSVERGTEAYDRLRREAVTTASRLEDVRASAQDASDAFVRAAGGAQDYAEAVSDVADGADEASEGLGDLVDKVAGGALAGAGMSAVNALTDAASAAGDAIREAAEDYDAAFARIDAACGDAVGSAQTLKDVGRDLYREGWGDSLDSLAEGLVTAREILGDVSETDLTYLTKGALALEETFGSDLSETLRGANVLMEKFGLSGEEAMDLIAAGTQRGLDYTDELGDNLSEYAGRWGDAGMEASEYFSLLEAGADNGAYSLDKVGDYLNEFLTSLTDGRMEEAIGGFSQGTREVFDSFKSGGATAQDVLDAVVGELRDMPDEYRKAQLASELWSSLGEDNAMSMIESLAGVEDSYGDVAGAAEDCAEKISDTAQNRAESALRKLADALMPLADLGADALGSVADGVALVSENLSGSAEHSRLMAEATRDLDDVIGEASGAVGGYGDTWQDTFERMAESAERGREALQRVADLKGSAADAFSSLGADASRLETYIGVIDELRDTAGLTKYEQDKLTEAVAAYNDITGESLEVVDSVNGVLSDSTEEIRDNADAWRDSAEAQAYASLYSQALEEQAAAAYELEAAQDALSDARERYQELQDKPNKSWDEIQEYNRLRNEMGALEQEVGDCQTSYDELSDSVEYFDEKAATSAARLGDEVSAAYEALPDDLREAGLGIATALQEGIESGNVGASEAASYLADAVASEVGSLPEEARKSGMDAAEQLAEAVASGSITAQQAAQVLSAACSGDLSGLPAELRGYGTDAVLALASAMGPEAPLGSAREIRSACDDVLSQLPADLRGYGAAAVEQMASAVSAGELSNEQAAQVVRAACTGELSKLPGDLGSYGTGAVAQLAGALSATGSVATSSGDLRDAAGGEVSEIPDDYSSAGAAAGATLASGIASARDAVSRAGSSLASASESAKSNNGRSYGWGSELGANLAAGIRSAYGAVVGAANSLAGAIAARLHFTEPDVGPLVGINDSGREMAENYAASMRSGVASVRRASEELAEAASFSAMGEGTASALSSSAASRPAGASGAVNRIGRVEVRVEVDAKGLSGREAADVTAGEFARAMRRALESI